jgi:hypothetical protein
MHQLLDFSSSYYYICVLILLYVSSYRLLAMHQLLDFPVNETDTISVVEGSQASLFAAGARVAQGLIH